MILFRVEQGNCGVGDMPVCLGYKLSDLLFADQSVLNAVEVYFLRCRIADEVEKRRENPTF